MGVLALLVSVAYHLQVPLAGVVAVDSLTRLLNREIQGELSIGELQNVTYHKLVARDVVIRDPQGREVIRVDRVAAWPDWSALWDGVIRIGRARARGGEVTLYVSGPEDDTVSLVDAFLPVDPSPPQGRPPPQVIVDGVVLDGVLVHGGVPGLEGLRIEDLHVEGRVEAQRDVRFRVYSGQGVMTGPYPGRTVIDGLTGYFDTDMTEGLDARARAHRGDDRVRAHIRLTRASEEAVPEMDLRAYVDPLHFDTLAEMEIAPGLDALEGSIRGTARLYGPTDDLRLTANLRSDAGRVQARGHLPAEGPLELEAWTHGQLQLGELVSAAPPLEVGGRIRLRIEPEDPPGSGERVQRLHAEVEPLSLEEATVPAFTLDALIERDALQIEGLHADHIGGRLDATGRVGFDGSLDVHAEARFPEISRDPNVRRLAPDARGSLTANVDVRAGPGMSQLRVDGRIAMRNARYGPVRADSLDLRGRAQMTDSPAPVLRLDGTAEGLVVSDVSLGAAQLSIAGGPGGYEVSASTRDPAAGTRLLVQGNARYTGEALTLNAPTLVIDLGAGEPWTGNVDLRFAPGRSVSVQPLMLRRPDESIRVEGIYRFRGRDDIEAQLMNVDLAQLRGLAPEQLEGLGGRVDALVNLRGDIDRRPQGGVTARIRDGSLGRLTGVGGTLDLQLEGRTLQTDVDLDLGPYGQIDAEGPIALSERGLRDPSRLLEEMDLEGVRVQARNLDLRLLALLGLVEDLPVDGRISTSVELTGSGLRPGLRDAVLVLDRVALEGWDPLRAKLRLTLAEGRLRIREGWVADAVGELGSVEADLPLSLDDPPRDLPSFWRQIHDETWSASIRMPQRRLDSWPRPVRDLAPAGLSVSMSLTAEGDERGPHADLSAVGRFVEAATEDRCAADLRPVVTLRGWLQHGLAEAQLTGFLGDRRATLQASIAAALPIDEWIQRGDVPRFPSTEITARVTDADLARVPYLCSYARGQMSASLTAKDLLTGQSVVGAVLDVPRLQLWEAAGERGEARLSTEYRLHVRSGSSPERDALTACALMSRADVAGTDGAACREVSRAEQGELLSRLRVPVRWVEGALLPQYVDGSTISSWSDFRSAHVEPVLSFIPGVVAGDAVMAGQLEVQGPLEGLQLAGQVELSDGHMQIEGLGQHLQDIQGRIVLRGDEAIFPEDRPLQVRDGGGTARAHGHIGFEGLVPRDLNLDVDADSFPIRREGMVLAWLSGGANVRGRVLDEATRSRIQTMDFLVRLPEQQAATLQPLEPHAEILVVGSERPAAPLEQRDAYPVHVTIDASDPFWVRRNDFAALIVANIEAVYRDPSLSVDGEARIQRGTFEIFGKRFELTEGRLSFDGTSELNPQVRITAVYEIPGRRGATVTVNVHGSLTEPEVEFASTETSDQAEIISLLVSGGTRDAGAAEQEASQQAASFLAGLTAGILTLGLREEFGDVIPVLAIESQGLGGTRIRAGFNANDLIPDFAREVITGAYIEGFFTAAAQDTNAAGGSAGGGGVGGGVTIEFTFPYNILMRGTYVPVDNGSVDVLFEP